MDTSKVPPLYAEEPLMFVISFARWRHEALHAALSTILMAGR